MEDFLAEDATGGIIAGHDGRSLLQNSALKIAFQQDAAAPPLVGDALGLNADMREFLEGSLRGQGLLVGERGDCYPLQVVATPQEAGLVENRDWLNDGSGSFDEEVPGEVRLDTLDVDEVRERDISGLLHERLSRERDMEREDEAVEVG